MEQANPDFLVTYIFGADMDAVKSKLDDEGKEILNNVPQAALIAMCMDAKTLKVIWASSAEADIKKDSSDEESKERIEYAVEEMFSDF